jgi:hypothetical protein
LFVVGPKATKWVLILAVGVIAAAAAAGSTRSTGRSSRGGLSGFFGSGSCWFCGRRGLRRLLLSRFLICGFAATATATASAAECFLTIRRQVLTGKIRNRLLGIVHFGGAPLLRIIAISIGAAWLTIGQGSPDAAVLRIVTFVRMIVNVVGDVFSASSVSVSVAVS